MIRCPLALLCAATLAFSEETVPPPAETAAQKLSHDALAALSVSLAENAAALESARTNQDNASVDRLESQRTRLMRDLERVTTGQDPASGQAPAAAPFDLQAEVTDLLKPIVEEVKAATKSPRDIEQLRTEIAAQRERLANANDALDRLTALRGKPGLPGGLAPPLADIGKKWESRRQSADTALSVAQFKLAELEAERGNVFDSLSKIFSNFFQDRGLNLVMAAAAATAIWLLLRWLRLRIERFRAAKKRADRSFSSRAAAVLFLVGSTLAAIVAVLAVFYLTSDWVLLGLSILLILGLVWAGKTALPRFFDQVKLMLNLGAVREGERVVIGGVPWEVKRLNVFSDFTNPALEGGTLRLPLRDVLPLTSRPFSPKEPWFPSASGDWVRLSDGLFGKVLVQTPEWVQVLRLGGSRKTYATADFVAANPESLAHNFRVHSTFGIGYEHQDICTTEVPATFSSYLAQKLREEFGEENLVHLRVEFASAGASSLDYEILADFTGEVSAKANRIRRALQRHCVDACNENGWEIPFQQITVHQA